MLPLPKSPVYQNRREMAANLRHPEDAVWMLRCHESDDSLLSIPSVMAEVVANRRRELARNDDVTSADVRRGGSACYGKPNRAGYDGRDLADMERKSRRGLASGRARDDELEETADPYLDFDQDQDQLPTPTFGVAPLQRFDRGSSQ
jgi:hypothetical protein